MIGVRSKRNDPSLFSKEGLGFVDFAETFERSCGPLGTATYSIV